jgi:hypothetical protein
MAEEIKNTDEKEMSAVVALLILAGLLVVLYFAVRLLWFLLDSTLTERNLQRTGVRLFISLGLFAGGFLLFWIRKEFRKFYGLSEIAFGLLANWHALTTLSSQLATKGADNSNLSLTKLAILGGGMYLIVRGIINIAESNKESNNPAEKESETSGKPELT